MFNRNDLTLTLFYASSTSDEGNKVAMFTVQVNNTDMVAVQSNTLQCITDKSGKKGYSVGEQTISNGSDPLLIALENYWRVNTEAVVNGLMADVSDFIAGNVCGVATGISTQDTLVEIVVSGTGTCHLEAGYCVMSRGSGSWEVIA
ncbi:hypothetical protein [Klebsiella variicola]|uniref:hypothetical protein n=1 Tax=Klebsiella variicola TaxID=244366 RepID=UPI0021C3ADB3|nr:hypothetical protein [Klebsiella variicola]